MKFSFPNLLTVMVRVFPDLTMVSWASCKMVIFDGKIFKLEFKNISKSKPKPKSHLVSEVLHILAIDSHQQVPGSQASAVRQGAGGYLDRRGVFRH